MADGVDFDGLHLFHRLGLGFRVENAFNLNYRREILTTLTLERYLKLAL